MGAKAGDAVGIGIEGAANAGAGKSFDGGDILLQEARERAKSPSVEPPTQTNLTDVVSKEWEQYRSNQLAAQEEANKRLSNVTDRTDINEFVDIRKETDINLIGQLNQKDLKAIGGIGAALAKNDVKAALEIFKQSYDKEHYDYDSMHKLDVGLNAEMQRRGLGEKWTISIAYGPDDGHLQIIRDLRSQSPKSQIIPIGK